MHISGGSSANIYTGLYTRTAWNSGEDWEDGERTFPYNLPSSEPYDVL